MRPGQQAKQHKHDDLCQPGHGVQKDDNGVVCTRLLVAHHKTGKIDGEKARRMHGIGECKDNQAR